MTDFFAIFVGGFIVLLGSIIIYRFLFDKERWNKSLDNARAVGAANKAKSEVKHQAMSERHDQLRAKSELKLQEMKERHAQNEVDRQVRAQEERELKAVIAERKRASPQVSRVVRSSKGRYKEDPLLAGVIGSLAAASLANDTKSALVNGEFLDGESGEEFSLDNNDDSSMSSDDGGDW